MNDDATFNPTRRRALARIGALALAAYTAPAITTLGRARAGEPPVSGPQPSFSVPSLSEPSKPKVEPETVRKGPDRDDSGPKARGDCNNDLDAKNCDRTS